MPDHETSSHVKARNLLLQAKTSFPNRSHSVPTLQPENHYYSPVNRGPINHGAVNNGGISFNINLNQPPPYHLADPLATPAPQLQRGMSLGTGFEQAETKSIEPARNEIGFLSGHEDRAVGPLRHPRITTTGMNAPGDRIAPERSVSPPAQGAVARAVGENAAHTALTPVERQLDQSLQAADTPVEDAAADEQRTAPPRAQGSEATTTGTAGDHAERAAGQEGAHPPQTLWTRLKAWYRHRAYAYSGFFIFLAIALFLGSTTFGESAWPSKHVMPTSGQNQIRPGASDVIETIQQLAKSMGPMWPSLESSDKVPMDELFKDERWNSHWPRDIPKDIVHVRNATQGGIKYYQDFENLLGTPEDPACHLRRSIQDANSKLNSTLYANLPLQVPDWSWHTLVARLREAASTRSTPMCNLLHAMRGGAHDIETTLDAVAVNALYVHWSVQLTHNVTTEFFFKKRISFGGSEDVSLNDLATTDQAEWRKVNAGLDQTKLKDLAHQSRTSVQQSISSVKDIQKHARHILNRSLFLWGYADLRMSELNCIASANVTEDFRAHARRQYKTFRDDEPLEVGGLYSVPVILPSDDRADALFATHGIWMRLFDLPVQ